MAGRLARWARTLRRESLALWFAARDPRTPWPAKLFAALVVAYAFSPIDLIPDPIPVLGYLDDLLIVPAGLWLALRLVPDEVMTEARARAATASEQPVSRAGAAAVIVIWLTCAVALGWLVLNG